MADSEFVVGDVVQLKSGGPAMTYEGQDMAGQAICTWFVGTKKSTETFNERSLEKGKKPSGFSQGRVIR